MKIIDMLNLENGDFKKILSTIQQFESPATQWDTYPELLDYNYLSALWAQGNFNWNVIVAAVNGQVIASGMLLLDPLLRCGYLDHLNIASEYAQSPVGGYLHTVLLSRLTQLNTLDLIYAELPCQVSPELKGLLTQNFLPLGILPQKFLVGAHRQDALFLVQLLNPPVDSRVTPRLIRAIEPLYEIARHHFSLPSAEYLDEKPMYNRDHNAVGHIWGDYFGYLYITFAHNDANDSIKFLYNPHSQSATKVWFSPSITPTTLKTLLVSTLSALHRQIHYMECYVTAYRPAIQQVFLDAGFKPQIFLPWAQFRDGHWNASVLMTYSKEGN